MNCKRLWAKATKNLALDCRESLAFGHPGWVVGDRVRKRSSACGGLSSAGRAFGARWLYGLSSVHWTIPSLSKTYMTRIEGENTRVASLFGTIAPQDVVLLKSIEVFSAFAAALSERWHRTYSRLIITFQQRQYLNNAIEQDHRNH